LWIESIRLYIVSFLKKLQLKGLDFIFLHIPNGGNRSKAEASKLKMMGVLAGAPDLMFLFKNRTAFVEFKIPSGKVSEKQHDFSNKAASLGHETSVIFYTDIRSGIEKVASFMAASMPDYQNEISSMAASFISGLAEKS
jgi:hypothetical protein